MEGRMKVRIPVSRTAPLTVLAVALSITLGWLSPGQAPAPGVAGGSLAVTGICPDPTSDCPDTNHNQVLL
jgi:hypothetical protein